MRAQHLAIFNLVAHARSHWQIQLVVFLLTPVTPGAYPKLSLTDNHTRFTLTASSKFLRFAALREPL